MEPPGWDEFLKSPGTAALRLVSEDDCGSATDRSAWASHRPARPRPPREGAWNWEESRMVSRAALKCFFGTKYLRERQQTGSLMLAFILHEIMGSAPCGSARIATHRYGCVPPMCIMSHKHTIAED